MIVLTFLFGLAELEAAALEVAALNIVIGFHK